jgi:predicted nucleotidyltransferase
MISTRLTLTKLAYTSFMSLPVPELASEVALRYEKLSAVQSVVIAGSNTSGQSDESSDIDLYVYVKHRLTLEQRSEVAAGAKVAEIGNSFWEPGDEWIDAKGGQSVDVMYRELKWIEEQLNRVVHDHQASIGYTTCFWYNVLHSDLLIDREAWFANLQTRMNQPYPAELKRNIIAKNWPILRKNMSSYRHQIELAWKRSDWVSVNHRITALLASYFDILFAINEQPHPGEKRLVTFAEQLCPKRPPGLREDVERLLVKRDVECVDTLLDPLDNLLKRELLLPA